METLKKLRIFFFGLSTSDLIEMNRIIRESEAKMRFKYEQAEQISNAPVPNCDGTIKINLNE